MNGQSNDNENKYMTQLDKDSGNIEIISADTDRKNHSNAGLHDMRLSGDIIGALKSTNLQQFFMYQK